MSETTDPDPTTPDPTAPDLTACDLADPRLARAKRAARVVGLFVPLGLVAVEARSFIGWPVVRAAASNVADVAVGEVAPFAEFGGWGLRLSVDGKVGIVMRRGEGLRIERRTGRPIVVTLDDAAAAAAALATAAEAADTRAEGGTA